MIIAAVLLAATACGGSTVTPLAVTGFTATPHTLFSIGGEAYDVLTAGKSYSLTNPDAYTLRFEIHSGDHVWSTASDVAEIEAQTLFQPAALINIHYQIKFEPNGANNTLVNTASWLVAGEIHNDDAGTGPGVATSPPVAVQLAGNKLQIWARYSPPGRDPSNAAGHIVNLTLWTSPTSVVPGVWNDIRLSAKITPIAGAGGLLQAWVNGRQVVNYQGPLGYTVVNAPTTLPHTYWLEGLYRNTVPESIAASYRTLQ
jgi:hypothetical protein